MIKRILLAFAIGLIATGLLMGLSYVADSFGFPLLASALFWQKTLLQGFAPPINIGTAAHPVYEGSPLNFLAFLASLPIGVLFYSLFGIRNTRLDTSMRLAAHALGHI